MKILRFDSVGGASGDMILSVLVDLGVDLQSLRAGLATLSVEGYEIEAVPYSDRGLHGTRVTVSISSHSVHPEHRHLREIRTILAASSLPPGVKELSLRVFERLAETEAKVHHTTPDRIHFHEVGAIDAIVDIAGSCLALHLLGIDQVVVGPLPLGCGTIQCEHGMLPNPGPATVELLKGHPVVQTDEPFELVTPTGAALLTEWKEGIPPPLGSSDVASRSQASEGNRQGPDSPPLATRHSPLLRAGHGFGHFTLKGRPNLLRAMILDSPAPHTTDSDECLVMECNLDDTVPELIGSLSQKLMAAGALEVFTTSVQMKKQRPGTLLTVLCRPPDRDGLADLIFSESTTFGIREHLTRRTMLDRRLVEVATPYGPVRVKIGTWKGRDVTRSPEHDDCLRRAQEHGVAVRTVYESALRAV